MRLAGNVGDDLQLEAHAERDGVRAVERDDAVVIAAAAAEAPAIAREGEAGHDEERDLGGRDDPLVARGFADEGIPRGGREFLDMPHGDELQLRPDHARIAEAVAAFLPQQLDVRLARERGEKGDGLRLEKRRMGGEGGGDFAGFWRAGIAQRFEADAHFAAEFGFGHGAKLNLAARVWQADENLARCATTSTLCAVPNPFQKRQPKAEIQKSAKPRAAKAAAGATKVGLKPKDGWQKRNFLTEVLIPSMFEPRAGGHAPPNFPELQEGEIGITWIGHASFLIQTREQNLLIDPNWAQWLKVFKRMKHPGLHLDDLPAIDCVLVTHAHFDHLDRKTLRGVAADQPIVVPFEVGNLVHDLGFRSVHELHYWESYQCGPAKITLTPAHHWGARVLHDTHRGFGGFVIEVAGRTIFHCGDTAYFDGFREIGERHAIDVALLPIGAYDPPSGREVHMTPEEALRAFVELGARRMVPMHYGTFRLSYEPLHEPPERLLVCAHEQGLAERITMMTEGEPMVF